MNDSNTLSKKREHQNGFVEKLANGPVNFLIRHGVNPNTLSYLGFFSSVGAAIFIAIGMTHMNIFFAWISPLLLSLSGIFDVLDGSLARKSGNVSKSGAFLDSNLDRISDATIILGLIYGGLIDYAWGFLLLFITIMISYIRSRAENEGLDIKGIGLMERAERMIFIWVALIIESWVYYLSDLITGMPFDLLFPILMVIYTCLLVLTIGQRIFFVFKHLNEENELSRSD
ncbi:MAG: CDP-alcohol phosphatidyltransferase family protein [Promethearchaeota archaeon]